MQSVRILFSQSLPSFFTISIFTEYVSKSQFQSLKIETGQCPLTFLLHAIYFYSIESRIIKVGVLGGKNV